MKTKLESYIGFAKRARKVVSGYNTCLLYMKRKKIKLLLLANDLSENTLKKMKNQAETSGTSYRIFVDSEMLGMICGEAGKSIFGITDGQFAKIIIQEIDNKF